MNKQAMLNGVRDYLLRHPEEVVRVVRNLFLFRIGLPLDAVRWAASQAAGGGMARDIQIEAVPPGFRIGATVELMGAVLRASVTTYIEDIRLNPREMRVEVRLADVSVKVLDEGSSPVAKLINSGAVDLSKPGDLASFMPKRPAMLVEAEVDRIAIDLMRHPAMRNQKVERLVGLITPILSIGAIRTDWEHLDVVFKPLQSGVAGALAAVRSSL